MILDLFWSRSESAIHETAAKYGNYCTKIAMNILQNHEDSEECVNDTYLKAWNAIPPQRPAILSSFLGRITRNLAINSYNFKRTQKRGGYELALVLNELEDCVPSSNSTEETVEAGMTVRAIETFLADLDSESRVVFVRRYWYVDSISAIAARFQISEGKVKSMLFRTRNNLRKHLEKECVII